MVRDQVVIHLPAALAELEQYKKEDTSVFSIDEDVITVTLPDGTNRKLKAGDYAVVRTEDELVISVDLD